MIDESSQVLLLEVKKKKKNGDGGRRCCAKWRRFSTCFNTKFVTFFPQDLRPIGCTFLAGGKTVQILTLHLMHTSHQKEEGLQKTASEQASSASFAQRKKMGQHERSGNPHYFAAFGWSSNCAKRSFACELALCKNRRSQVRIINIRVLLLLLLATDHATMREMEDSCFSIVAAVCFLQGQRELKVERR